MIDCELANWLMVMVDVDGKGLSWQIWLFGSVVRSLGAWTKCCCSPVVCPTPMLGFSRPWDSRWNLALRRTSSKCEVGHLAGAFWAFYMFLNNRVFFLWFEFRPGSFFSSQRCDARAVACRTRKAFCRMLEAERASCWPGDFKLSTVRQRTLLDLGYSEFLDAI